MLVELAAMEGPHLSSLHLSGSHLESRTNEWLKISQRALAYMVAHGDL